MSCSGSARRVSRYVLEVLVKGSLVGRHVYSVDNGMLKRIDPREVEVQKASSKRSKVGLGAFAACAISSILGCPL